LRRTQKVRLIPRELRALHLELFPMSSKVALCITFSDNKSKNRNKKLCLREFFAMSSKVAIFIIFSDNQSEKKEKTAIH